MYRVSFKFNGMYYSFDFDDQSEALKFFICSRKCKELSEVTYFIL